MPKKSKIYISMEQRDMDTILKGKKIEDISIEEMAINALSSMAFGYEFRGKHPMTKAFIKLCVSKKESKTPKLSLSDSISDESINHCNNCNLTIECSICNYCPI